LQKTFDFGPHSSGQYFRHGAQFLAIHTTAPGDLSWSLGSNFFQTFPEKSSSKNQTFWQRFFTQKLAVMMNIDILHFFMTLNLHFCNF
jgi:hypothetical protein